MLNKSSAICGKAFVQGNSETLPIFPSGYNRRYLPSHFILLLSIFFGRCMQNRGGWGRWPCCNLSMLKFSWFQRVYLFLYHTYYSLLRPSCILTISLIFYIHAISWLIGDFRPFSCAILSFLRAVYLGQPLFVPLLPAPLL